MTATADFPVLVFTNSMVMGGMEEHVLQLGRGLRARGFRVGVICSSDEAIAPLRDALAASGVEVHALAARQATLAGALPRLRALAGVLRRYRGAVVHLHVTGHRGGDLVTLAALLSGARAVVRSVHLPPVGSIGARERAMVRVADSQLSRIICVSQETRRAHLTALGRDEKKCVVVHNGIDLERFSPRVVPLDVRAAFGIDAAAPIVGTVARLGEARKGIDRFVDAAAIVSGRVPEARFLVVGDGSLRPALERQAARLGLGDRLIFAGQRDDIPAILTSLSVFVSPSLYEACQYNLLEAMASGLPVVTTLTGVAPEVIRDGETGRSAPVGDTAALARAITEVLERPADAAAMGLRARALMEERFSVETMVDGIVSVYRDVI